MKNKLQLFTLLCVIAIPQLVLADNAGTNYWGMETNGVQMSIRLASGESDIVVNQGVKLLVRFRNVSTNAAIYIYRRWVDSADSYAGLSYQITSPSGQTLLPNNNILSGGSGGDNSLPPGRVIEYEFDLGKFCKFSEVGTYKIVATKSVTSNDKICKVVSNPLIILAVPSK